MNLQTALTVLQIAVAVILIGLILLQRRGTGLSGIFGGDSAIYRTKRGAEKMLFYLTIGFSVLFLTVAGVNLFV